MKIKNLYNKELGRRCFILANGPSVKNFDLSKLKNEIVIGMNASTLLEKEFDFVQTYYTVSDTRFFDIEFKKELATTLLHPSTKKIFRKEISRFCLDEKNTFYVSALERDGFSFNLQKGYHYGCTTVMLALQLAYYLGCKEIFLLGFDLNYSSNSPRFYQESNIQVDDSKASVQILNVANAAIALQNRGTTLYNCNPESLARNYIPYKDFNSIFLQKFK